MCHYQFSLCARRATGGTRGSTYSGTMHRVLATQVRCTLVRPVPCCSTPARPRDALWQLWLKPCLANHGSRSRACTHARQLRCFTGSSYAGSSTGSPTHPHPVCVGSAVCARGTRGTLPPSGQWVARARSISTHTACQARGWDDASDGTDDDQLMMADPVQLLAEAGELADLRHPHKWCVPAGLARVPPRACSTAPLTYVRRYPAARDMKRRVVLHVGPTNSGKTYQALKALERAESGLYLGPLRLLAWEVHQRLNEAGALDVAAAAARLLRAACTLVANVRVWLHRRAVQPTDGPREGGNTSRTARELHCRCVPDVQVGAAFALQRSPPPTHAYGNALVQRWRTWNRPWTLLCWTRFR